MAESASEVISRIRASKILMQRSQDILLCCEQYPPSVGGVQEVMRQIAERLAGMGHRVTVATSRHPQRQTDTKRNGVRVVSFDIKGNAVKGLTGDVEGYQKFLRESDFDIILIKAAQQWSFDGCIQILSDLRARKTFIPCGFSALHDPDYAEYYSKMPNWLNKFDSLIFYSNTYQDIEFARQHGITQLYVVPNGVDEREFVEADVSAHMSRLGVAEDCVLLLSVGTLIVAKGHWEVVNAYRKANIGQPSCLVINGNRPSEFLLRKIARSLRDMFRGYPPLWLIIAWVNSTARLTGNRKQIKLVDLPRERLIPLYRGADLFVFASHMEYSPLVLFEAAAAGVPFISSDVGNAREIAEWTGSGRVVRCTEVCKPCVVDIDMFTAAVEDSARQGVVSSSLREKRLAEFSKTGLFWRDIIPSYESIIISNRPNCVQLPQ